MRKGLLRSLAAAALAVAATGATLAPATAAPTANAGVVAAAQASTIAGCPAAATYPIARGSTGATVRLLQCLLNGMGFANPDLGLSGTFGPRTEQAVMAFKFYAFGRVSDGIVGPGTWSALIRIARTHGDMYAPVMNGCTDAAHIPVTVGSTGPSVRLLQCLLNATSFVGDTDLVVDGIFGPATKAAVLRFKRYHFGSATDSIVGPTTWEELLWTCQCGG